MYTLLLLLLDPLVWRNRREDPNNPPPPLANTDSNETTGCASVVVLKHAVTIVPAYCKRGDIISQRLRWKISIAGLRSLAAIKTEEK